MNKGIVMNKKEKAAIRTELAATFDSVKSSYQAEIVSATAPNSRLAFTLAGLSVSLPSL